MSALLTDRAQACNSLGLLPNPGASLDASREFLTLDSWNELPWWSQEHEGHIGFPRFQALFKMDLPKSLQALGGEEIKGSDFPGIGGGKLVIIAVIHEAVLEVNEEGWRRRRPLPWRWREVVGRTGSAWLSIAPFSAQSGTKKRERFCS